MPFKLSENRTKAEVFLKQIFLQKSEAFGYDVEGRNQNGSYREF